MGFQNINSKRINNKFIHNFLAVFLTYFVGSTVSLLLSLILNVRLGIMTFGVINHHWSQIFFHNVIIVLVIIFSGFLMSIPSFLLIFINGFIFGAVLGQSIISNQVLELLVTTLPHGIPEIAAFLMAGEISLSISKKIARKEFQITSSLLIKVVICILLIFLSSILESVGVI